MTWIRNQPCPFCGSKSGYAINNETEGYICHRCKATGTLRKLGLDLDHQLKPVQTERRQNAASGPIFTEEPSKHWESLQEAKPGGLTEKYLLSRGIRPETWLDLGLREGVLSLMGEKGIYHIKVCCAYSFKDYIGRVVAIHYVRPTPTGKEKRYLGPKSLGVAMLKSTKAFPVIVSEGLENALAYRQVKASLKNGVLVAGDSGNMIKYSADHHIQLLPYKYILVEDSDSPGIKASAKFQSMFKVVNVFHTTPVEDALDILLKK